jgi:glycosyltransferase involved in cell wall biosynthesis
MFLKTPKIVAISVVRNEADIVALSVVNMLTLGVDAVIVLDNSSSDATLSTLEMLVDYDDRVIVINDGSEFNQKALMAKCLQLANSISADWVMPFDADEFWAIDPNVRLHDYIASVDSKGFSMVSVDPNQYIVSGNELDFFDFSNFGIDFSIRHRISNDLLHSNLKRYLRGNCSFLEIKQPPKMIFKTLHLDNISAGQHGAEYTIKKRTLKQDFNGTLQLFHLPFRSFNNLKGKADQGLRLIEAGMPKKQGWQHRFWAGMSSEELTSEWNKLHIKTNGNGTNYLEADLTIWDDRLHHQLCNLRSRSEILKKLF